MGVVRDVRAGEERAAEMNAVTSVEQNLKLHYAEVRRRLFTAKPKPVDKPVIVSLVKPEPVIIPAWQKAPTMFDEHVIAYQVAMRVNRMIETGEVVLTDPSRRTVLQIVKGVLEEFPGISIADLKSPTRNRKIVKARQIAMYEIRRQRPDMSLPAIGRWFGGRDHTTALHSIRMGEIKRKEG